MRVSRVIYAVTACVFVAGVVTQVFIAGLVVVAKRIDWSLHIDLGHGLGLPLAIMLIFMYTGKLPRNFKRLTWGLFGLYFIQADIVIFMRTSAPVVSAIHPVIALFDFALGLMLARRALSLIRHPEAADTVV